MSFFGLLGIGWFFLDRLKSLLQKNPETPSLLLMQQQIDPLRLQFSQNLDNSTQAIQPQLGQLLGQVQQRWRENADVLSQTQQTFGRWMDQTMMRQRKCCRAEVLC